MKSRIPFMVILLSLLAGCGGAKTEETKSTSGTPPPSSNSSKPSSRRLDACGLLTKADAESLMGGSVKEPTTTRNEMSGIIVSQCRYSDAAGDKQVGLLARQAPTATEAKQVFGSARNASKDRSEERRVG